MLTSQIKLPNGNIINYKIIGGTAYHAETPQAVCEILENSRINRQKIRIFLGDVQTGRDWMEEYDTFGHVGRSTGNIKVPLLIKSARSMGGSSILDHCIVKISIDKRVVYQHPTYHLPDIDNQRGERYVAFIKGERNAK